MKHQIKLYDTIANIATNVVLSRIPTRQQPYSLPTPASPVTGTLAGVSYDANQLIHTITDSDYIVMSSQPTYEMALTAPYSISASSYAQTLKNIYELTSSGTRLLSSDSTSYNQNRVDLLLTAMSYNSSSTLAALSNTVMATFPVYGGGANDWRSHAAIFYIMPIYNSSYFYGEWGGPVRCKLRRSDSTAYWDDALMVLGSSNYWHSTTAMVFAANTTSGTTYSVVARRYAYSSDFPVNSAGSTPAYTGNALNQMAFQDNAQAIYY